jgi:hypothetical protein
MSIRRCLILAWMVAGLQLLSAGQNPVQNPSTQSSGNDSSRTAPAAALSAIAGMRGDGGTEDTSNTLPQIPGFLGGVGISPAFLSEMEKSNYLRGGLNVGATYDDNPQLISTEHGSNTSESIFPNIQIDQTTSRVHWMLGYAGGLTVNQKLTNQNQGSHGLNFDSQYRLSPHVNLRIGENFSLTTGFFDSGNGTAGTGGSGVVNASLLTPLSTQRSNATTVETNYHFALNDLIGASGSFNDSHFTPAKVTGGAQTQQLTDTQTASGSAFWLHRLFGADWGGVSYRFDRIVFNGGESRVHSFLAVDTLNLSKRVTLTGFVGPEYSENQGLVPGAQQSSQSNEWSVAGGAEVGWRNQHTSASAGYSRTTSDGGGLLGAVRLQTVHADFRRQLAPGWAVAVTASHGTNRAITVPATTSGVSASSINLTSAGVSLERNVGKSIGLRMGYSHDFQEQLFPVPTPTQDAHRNRFFVTLSYQWAKPLGM